MNACTCFILTFTKFAYPNPVCVYINQIHWSVELGNKIPFARTKTNVLWYVLLFACGELIYRNSNEIIRFMVPKGSMKRLQSQRQKQNTHIVMYRNIAVIFFLSQKNKNNYLRWFKQTIKKSHCSILHSIISINDLYLCRHLVRSLKATRKKWTFLK